MILEKRQKNNRMGIIFFVVFLLSIIFVVLFLLFEKKETHFSESINDDKIVAISCEKNTDENSFFYDNSALNGTDKLKITFSRDKPQKLFYDYLGKYNSKQIAETHHAILQSKYYEYLGNNGISLNDFSFHFAHFDNAIKIELFSEASKLSGLSGALFFIDELEFTDFFDKNESEIANFYEKKGFSCESIK